MPPKKSATRGTKSAKKGATKTKSASVSKTKPKKEAGKQEDSEEEVLKDVPFRFLDLPHELRMSVYKMALVYHSYYPMFAWTIKKQAPLLQTCKQIRSEASETFYKYNKFHIHVESFCFCPLKKVLDCIGIENSKAITKMTMFIDSSIGWGNVKGWLEMKEELLSPSVKVKYQSMSPPLKHCWGAACQMGERLREDGLDWDQVAFALHQCEHLVLAANFVRVWPDREEMGSEVYSDISSVFDDSD